MPASKALSVTDDILLLGKAPPSTGAIPFLHTRPLPVRKVIPEDPTSKVFNPPDNTPPLLRPTPLPPFPRLIPPGKLPAAKNSILIVNSSTTSKIPNIWGSGTVPSFKYGRFVGLANQGWKVYDSTNGLPAPILKNGEYKSGHFLGFGVGAGYDLSLRTGINFDLIGTSGTAALDLKDQIQFNWTKDSTNFYLSSQYLYQPSKLTVAGPNATVTVSGRADINGNVYILGDSPFTDWKKLWSNNIAFNSPLFTKSFGSGSSQSVSLLGNIVSLDYQGINLDSSSSTNFGDGVRSNVLDPVFKASLDLDKAIGTFIGYPNGLNFGASINLGALKGSASLTLADLSLEYSASIAQQISAKVDSVTGILNLEGGKKLNYKVGDLATLPRAIYDVNNDGKLDITGVFTKMGTVANNTDIVTNARAVFEALKASISAEVKVFGFSKRFSANAGPLVKADWDLMTDTFNAYSNTWSANLGTSTQSFSLV